VAQVSFNIEPERTTSKLHCPALQSNHISPKVIG